MFHTFILASYKSSHVKDGITTLAKLQGHVTLNFPCFPNYWCSKSLGNKEHPFRSVEMVFAGWVILCTVRHYYFPLESTHCRKFCVFVSLYHYWCEIRASIGELWVRFSAPLYCFSCLSPLLTSQSTDSEALIRWTNSARVCVVMKAWVFLWVKMSVTEVKMWSIIISDVTGWRKQS